MDERRGERAEHEQEPALEPAADPRGLDDRGRERRRHRLHEHVAVAEMRELVRDDSFELGRGGDREQPRGDRERRAPAGAAACRERPRIPVADQVEPWRRRRRRAAESARPSQWSAGASAGSSSRAPTMPIAIRSAYQ